MNRLRLVVVGPGLIGKKHIELISQRADTDLVSIVAPERPANRLLAAQLAVAFHPNLSDCLRRERPDGVIVSSPNGFHSAHAVECLKRGIPVLIEKPITATVREAQELVALAKSTGTRVMVGHHRAHSPLMATARNVIQGGRLGQLVAVSGSAQFIKPKQYFLDGPWRTRLGGGPILINLIHEIGNLRALCGEITEVQAMASSMVRGYEVEDTVVINLQFASGVLGSFVLSDTAASVRSWEQTSGENPAYPQYPGEDCYLVTGTRGSLAIPSMLLRYFPDDTEPSWWSPPSLQHIPVEPKDPLACQMDNFVSVIRGEAEPIVSAADGLQNLIVTQAIAESARSRRSVRVEAPEPAMAVTGLRRVHGIRSGTLGFAGALDHDIRG